MPSSQVYRRHRFRGANFPAARFDYDDPIDFLQHIFENPITNLHATLDVIRASLPAFMERFGTSNESGSHDPTEEEEMMDDFIDSFELLVCRISLPPPPCHEAHCRCESNISHLLPCSALRRISNIGGQFDHARRSGNSPSHCCRGRFRTIRTSGIIPGVRVVTDPGARDASHFPTTAYASFVTIQYGVGYSKSANIHH